MTNYSTERMLSGIGTITGPTPNAQFNTIVELIQIALPLFSNSTLEQNITNENGLNRQLARFFTNISYKMGFPYFASSESMEDEAKGSSPATDIGFHLYIDDLAADPPKITVFEGKRLTAHLEPKRRREYVIGHEKNGKHIKCGGIERFKHSIHGGKFIHAGMIGYLQDGTPNHWRDQINGWISDLSSQLHDPAWSDKERLTLLITGGPVTECSSVVYRKTGELHLKHLWINLVL